MAITRLPRRTSEFLPFASTLTPSVAALEDSMRRMFEEPFSAEFPVPAMRAFPAAEITETPDEFTLTAEAPGMTRKDLQLSFEKGVLTIRGEKEEKQEKKERRYHLVERAYGSFQRSFSFPGSVDGAKVNATFADGVLTVHLPKNEETKATGRQIEIGEEKNG